jgi:hypothetical protein
MKRIILWTIVALLAILLGTVCYTFNQIYRQVNRITAIAKSEFPGEAVEALSSLIESDLHGFEQKNTAIWALGQLADPEALPLLEQLDAETPEDSVPFDRSGGLSKYEIEKAIKWCTKGNLTSWMYTKIK